MKSISPMFLLGVTLPVNLRLVIALVYPPDSFASGAVVTTVILDGKGVIKLDGGASLTAHLAIFASAASRPVPGRSSTAVLVYEWNIPDHCAA
ncbi:RxLR-like protein [Plasmopara halstedii]|uniref:RxLR-like protein n=1 Tax=Plasmopara halstedii TaxID=4781 RepID=A0A0P1AQV4_PLAHL|nr:RxLR-like protein [Plasmopara halstedii]CEG43730.1 RxLR-like protein [Plasmopara halstedii]|eukprot:XP_024580099.1 RxLR-like protein [Plasmopara halstedii]